MKFLYGLLYCIVFTIKILYILIRLVYTLRAEIGVILFFLWFSLLFWKLVLIFPIIWLCWEKNDWSALNNIIGCFGWLGAAPYWVIDRFVTRNNK